MTDEHEFAGADVPPGAEPGINEAGEAERPEGPCKMVDGVYVALEGDELADYLDRLANPPPPPLPDGPTLSDWRVALLKMGRFNDVKASVIAARDGGSVEGAIAWERFEYANNVYRRELVKLAPIMGFSEAEIDESLRQAAAIAGGG